MRWLCQKFELCKQLKQPLIYDDCEFRQKQTCAWVQVCLCVLHVLLLSAQAGQGWQHCTELPLAQEAEQYIILFCLTLVLRQVGHTLVMGNFGLEARRFASVKAMSLQTDPCWEHQSKKSTSEVTFSVLQLILSWQWWQCDVWDRSSSNRSLTWLAQHSVLESGVSSSFYPLSKKN